MACGFDKGLIAAYYDGEATAGERAEMERHLATCPECARDLASMKELSASLKSLGRASAPASIADSIAREVTSGRRAARPWLRWGVAAAAGLLIGVGVIAVIQDRQGPPRGENFALAPKQHQEAPRVSEKKIDNAERGPADNSDFAKKPATDSAPPMARRDGGTGGKDEEAPPRAPALPEPEKKADDMAGKLEKDAPKDPKPTVPVIQVMSSDVALARAEVEAFLKERELAVKPGAPLLGRSAYVKDHYLQVELTDEEVALLEKRLAALKKTGVARGTLEAERKRVEEAEALLDLDQKRARAEPAPTEAPAEGRSGAAAAKAKEEDSREATRALGGIYALRRAKVILVFLEPPPAKK